VSPTYKGLHQYGRRSKRGREIIEREVPAIVSPELWERAQQALAANQVFLSNRHPKHDYLLRGLMKCDLCGLTYIGSISSSARKPYYRCNGKVNARGINAESGRRCPSANVAGHIEEVIWSDIERFLRDPGEVMDRLSERLQDQAGEVERWQTQIGTGWQAGAASGDHLCIWCNG
jgi:site-specific DNA recombinase